MSGSINPNEQLSVTLSARQWNLLMQAADAGIGSVAAVLQDIQRQCMEQQRMPMPEHMAGRVGGAAFGGPRPNGEAQEEAS